MSNPLLVKEIKSDTLIHRSGMEPQTVHVVNVRVTLLWHLTSAMYLAQLEVGMTADELKVYQQLTDMITERVSGELARR